MEGECGAVRHDGAGECVVTGTHYGTREQAGLAATGRTESRYTSLRKSAIASPRWRNTPRLARFEASPTIGIW
jgi:hypothetical protein